MNWLKKLALAIADLAMRQARNSPDVSAKEFEQWKKEYKKDFGKDFK